MGYDTDRFVNFDPSSHSLDVVCSICTGVFENPIYTRCKHVFCAKCLYIWMGDATDCRCPLCNATIEENQLKRVPKNLRNTLNNLTIKCSYAGCESVIKLKDLPKHKKKCPHKSSDSCSQESPEWTRPARQNANQNRRRAGSDLSRLLQDGRRNDSGTSTSENSRRVEICRAITKHILLTVFYEILLGHFMSMAIFGFTFDGQCSEYPGLPWVLITVGISASIWIILFAVKQHLDGFQRIPYSIAFIFLTVAVVGQVCLYVILVQWYIKGEIHLLHWTTRKPRINCSNFLVIYTVASVTIETLMFGMTIGFFALRKLYIFLISNLIESAI